MTSQSEYLFNEFLGGLKKQDFVYTACYCEENVWLICDRVRCQHPNLLPLSYVVFISNTNKQVPLWKQKSSRADDGLVVWDYHVIFLLYVGQRCVVLDLDTSLDFPCSFGSYLSEAIRRCSDLKPEFRRCFRVVEAERFLQVFASDRSHMLRADNTWLATPPSYPCIHTTESTNNLAEFVSMEPRDGRGQVLTYDQLSATFTSKT